MPTIYVYRKASSTGARELSQAVGGKRWRGRVRPIAEVVKPGDSVICWGEALPAMRGVNVLNGAPIANKLSDALKLKEAGIATIEAARQKPAPVAAAPPPANNVKPVWEEAVEAAEDFIEIPFAPVNPVFQAGVRDFNGIMSRLLQAMAAPPVAPAAPAAQAEWLGRTLNHVGGIDLLNPAAQAPEYWVKKESIVEEIRIHSFNGKSIRAGIKRPRPGVQQHPWIRSYDGGWSIIYDGFESKKAQRELAHAAVKALGLQFGAVDLGKRADGKWMVLEVNRAAGLEGGTVEAYANAIKTWVAQPAR